MIRKGHSGEIRAENVHKKHRMGGGIVAVGFMFLLHSCSDLVGFVLRLEMKVARGEGATRAFSLFRALCDTINWLIKKNF